MRTFLILLLSPLRLLDVQHQARRVTAVHLSPPCAVEVAVGRGSRRIAVRCQDAAALWVGRAVQLERSRHWGPWHVCGCFYEEGEVRSCE